MFPMEYIPEGKENMVAIEYTLMVQRTKGKAWFYERLFFQMIIIMAKDKKRYSIADTISIKISFMLQMKWTRVMSPVVFKEFGVVYISFDTFFLSLSLSIGKRSTLARIRRRGGYCKPQPPSFYEPGLYFKICPKTNCVCYNEIIII